MKIMILSDSHSVSKTDLLTLLKNNSVNYYIHCGDIYMTYDGINLNSFYLVRGNNDFGNIPDELFITIDDLKFYIVHGHRYDVDYNLDYLTHIAKEKGADIVCFGTLIDLITIFMKESLLLILVVFVILEVSIVIQLIVFLILRQKKVLFMMSRH